jgi:hypothetical protein
VRLTNPIEFVRNVLSVLLESWLNEKIQRILCCIFLVLVSYCTDGRSFGKLFELRYNDSGGSRKQAFAPVAVRLPAQSVPSDDDDDNAATPSQPSPGGSFDDDDNDNGGRDDDDNDNSVSPTPPSPPPGDDDDDNNDDDDDNSGSMPTPPSPPPGDDDDDDDDDG